MGLSKDALIQAAKPKCEKVVVGDGDIYVSEIAQDVYDSIVENPDNKNEQGDQNWHKTMSSLIIASVVNEDGTPIFTEEEKDVVGKFSREVRKVITDACMKANGFSVEEKNDSRAIGGDSNIGESQLPLDLGIQTN